MERKIRELRDEQGVLQRQLAALLEIDTPMFSKIERGDRRAKREHVMLEVAKLVTVAYPHLLHLALNYLIFSIRSLAAKSHQVSHLVSHQVLHRAGTECFTEGVGNVTASRKNFTASQKNERP